MLRRYKSKVAQEFNRLAIITGLMCVLIVAAPWLGFSLPPPPGYEGKANILTIGVVVMLLFLAAAFVAAAERAERRHRGKK